MTNIYILANVNGLTDNILHKYEFLVNTRGIME